MQQNKLDEYTIIDADYEILPKQYCYEGNHNVLKSGIKIRYGEEHVEEFVKCSRDILYFIENYGWIVDPDLGKVLITLREYQERFLLHLDENRFSVILSARQIGKSTISALYILYYSIFNKDKKSAILANKEAVAKEIFNKIKIAYTNLPYWMQPGVVEWNKTSIQFGNGSHIFCAATSESAIRGLTINGVLFLDEFAFLKRTLSDEFFASVYPTITAAKESKLIIVSTPNGLNHFWSVWEGAKRGKNTFKAFRVYWYEVPGRDEKWKEETIKNIGLRKWYQEYEARFLGSTKTLISAKVLEKLEPTDFLYMDMEDRFYVYEEPVEGGVYVMGVDTSKGVGGDYSVTQVFRLQGNVFTQVAMFRDNQTRTIPYATMVHKIAEWYNEAFIVVENNSEGISVIEHLHYVIEYENLIHDKKKNDLGIRAKTNTKDTGLTILKELVETDRMIIRDADTIFELSKFEEKSNGKFGAEDGEYDDTVMACKWAAYFTKSVEYLDASSPSAVNELEQEIIEQAKKRREEEIAIAPMMFYQDEEDAFTLELYGVDIESERAAKTLKFLNSHGEIVSKPS